MRTNKEGGGVRNKTIRVDYGRMYIFKETGQTCSLALLICVHRSGCDPSCL